MRTPFPARRGLAVALLLAAGFASAVGLLSSSERARPQADRTQPFSSHVVTEYPPMGVDELPLQAESEAGEVSDLADESPRVLETRGVIARGESLSAALRRQGIEPATIQLISRELRPVFDFRRSRPGDSYRLGRDPDGRVLDFRYNSSPEKSYHLAWNGASYEAREDRIELLAQPARLIGMVDTSLYDAIRDLGEQTQLANDLADIFAWDIDFSRGVHPGDEFQILYERLYRSDETGEQVYVKPGRILAARYRGEEEHAVVYFEDGRGRGSYYRPDGSAIERAFLVAPLQFSRISSAFSKARQHPILKITRPHHGIDYAAAHGTPLWAVGDGTVIFRGWAGASGNLIKIRHANGYVSHYAHLSRFEKGLAVGSPVTQKQVIGYVGSTGLSTGSHVCFRMERNGSYVNPVQIGRPPARSVPKERWPLFKATRDLQLSQLDTGPALAAADEAL